MEEETSKTTDLNKEQISETDQQEKEEDVRELPDMKYGYIVGVKPDGEFVFESLGSEQGLVQLLGLHKYAEHRLNIALDINTRSGTAFTSQQQAQTQQMLKVILNILTQQSKDSIPVK